MSAGGDKPFVIAIDGPSAAGKSTVARQVAERLGLPYLDSGALYRTVALAALDLGTDLDDGEALGRLAAGLRIELSGDGTRVLSGDEDVTERLRGPEVSHGASRVSAVPAVREVLRETQRAIVGGRGAVAEGRDMGTIMFPDAQLKVFLDADPAERVRRRTAERAQPPSGAEQVGRELAERDRRDRSREVAPLEPATDAVQVDSTALSIDEVVTRIIDEAVSRGFPVPKKF